MGDNLNSRSKQSWGWNASYCLFCKWNCSEATVQTAQDMLSKQDDTLIKASSGLEGGVASSGSTCGVVSGGALSLALAHVEALRQDGLETEARVVSAVGEYVKWFGQKYRTTKCRERSKVNFWTLGGVTKYVTSPAAMLRCLTHINGAMQYLHDEQERDLPTTAVQATTETIHCAQKVLEGIRERTGIGDPLLERISIALDGGVGLQGGACGALAAAVMAVNIPMGINLRYASLIEALQAFFSGHKYLRTEDTHVVDEPYDVGKRIVMKFREVAHSVDCSEITGERFADWNSFQSYIHSSNRCHQLIDLAIDQGALALEEYQQVN